MTWPVAFVISAGMVLAGSLVGWLSYLRLWPQKQRLDALEAKVQQIWNALAVRQGLTAQHMEQKVR